ncbi:phytase [Xanthocytophaga agilis]|uniref:Phytase n=1 Tax=Xanthocytophaga agilis TaxID=3048010 RepID=A0AAE3R0X6_9BACT|nr:phytase [Xanthocytophaga agilis]MDJ1499669.1 phytase [Xanthocytophaga agilis]
MKYIFLPVVLLCMACGSNSNQTTTSTQPSADTIHTFSPVYDTATVIQPVYTTDTTLYDTDDPAIWINPANASESLVLGTDKNENGALYVYNLKGKIIADKVVKGLKRPNNVDIEYGVMIGGKLTDIAVVTERLTHKLRVYSLPSMQTVDGGGLPVFEGEPADNEFRDLMGISLYKNPANGKIYAIVGRKTGPSKEYLWQYLLEDNGKGQLKATLVRKFGTYSGAKEIESIAVDDALGYVYYSDETVGVRKYYADPDKGNDELALFATTGFSGDHEGISIYAVDDKTGYILVSDQQADKFHIFTREGSSKNPHRHQLLKVVKVASHESDGSDITALPLGPDFPHGLFIAMSDNRTFGLYSWDSIAGKDLKKAESVKHP